MELESYTTFPPEAGETAYDYCRRLENVGHEEMFMRGALIHYGLMEMTEFSDFFDRFGLARMRHIAMIRMLGPNRNEYSMTKKISKNLGISEKRAEEWFARFKETGNIHFIGEEWLKH